MELLEKYPWYEVAEALRARAEGTMSSRYVVDFSKIAEESEGEIISRFLRKGDYRIVAEEGDVEGDVRTEAEIDEEDDIVSEELAEIYLLQGLRSEAIEIPKLDVKKFNITDDSKFALDFLKEKRVLLIPGSGFNWKQPDHFRVVYLPEMEVLSSATEKMADFLATYRQK